MDQLIDKLLALTQDFAKELTKGHYDLLKRLVLIEQEISQQKILNPSKATKSTKKEDKPVISQGAMPWDNDDMAQTAHQKKVEPLDDLDLPTPETYNKPLVKVDPNNDLPS